MFNMRFMKSYFKLSYLFGFILCVVFVFASCGKKSAGDYTSKVTFMIIDNNGNPLTGSDTNKVLNHMREWTGVDVDFQFVAADEYNKKLSETLKSSHLPMIVHVNTLNQEIVEFANNDKVWDLNQFIWDEKKYPNLSQANKNVCKNLEVGGKLIGIYKARDIGRNGLSYRTDWAEKFGLGEPKTAEDIYNMMYAFTYGDPDGNGIDDTTGLAMCSYTGPFDVIQTWFGVGNAWVEQKGNIIPVHQTAEYKDCLDWLRKCYEEGLMPKDWATRDTKSWQNQVRKGYAGVYIDVMDGGRRIWDGFNNDKVKSVTDPSKIATMTLLGAVNNKTLATSGFNGFLMITKGAETKEQAEQCLHYIDKMCDDEMVIMGTYGLKDLHYKVEGGYVVPEKGADAHSYAALNQATVYIPHALTAAKPAIKQTERKMKEIAAIERNAKYAVFNPASAYLANSETYAAKGATLDKIISDARTKYVCGEIDEEGLQTAFDNWNKAGGTAVLAEVNAQYRTEATSGR